MSARYVDAAEDYRKIPVCRMRLPLCHKINHWQDLIKVSGRKLKTKNLNYGKQTDRDSKIPDQGNKKLRRTIRASPNFLRYVYKTRIRLLRDAL